MANKEHIKVLQQGVLAWNEWKKSRDLLESADLSDADLSDADFTKAGIRDDYLRELRLRAVVLSGVDFRHVDLKGTSLVGAELVRADLSLSDLSRANLSSANLRGASLRAADLTEANLSGADLRGVNLTRATLYRTNFRSALLSGANLDQASVGMAVFAEVDLSEVTGLRTVMHTAPSDIGVSTIYRSGGNLPEEFLLGCGIPESFIQQMKALVTSIQPLQFYSCFISYSGRDEEFARRLHSRMREAGLRVWFAPEDMKGGDKLYDQIDRAIQVHDRLLLVLSESSLRSRWVETEIRRARKVELGEGRRKLFPIRLVSYEALREWTCIDSATGEDLAEEVRGYFIPDFSNWKSHDDFERAFARLLDDLKASAVQNPATDEPSEV